MSTGHTITINGRINFIDIDILDRIEWPVQRLMTIPVSHRIVEVKRNFVVPTVLN